MLVKACLVTQLDPYCTHPTPVKAASHRGSCIAPNRLPRARCAQHLSLACARVLPKRLQTNTNSGQLQTTSEQDPISFTNSISKGRAQQAPHPCEVNSAFCCHFLHSSSRAVVIAEPHSQPA
ncbi:hypothetical protein HJG60_010630 [Phyllostomus discolor]|uniref:Uncharacterized protein n=1 Tax=Phyllostomus discolor TaxID=89673 RepID=A0A834ANH5_9CHIR|nr:hypothetical protein HJG60_010630 [Phyllostomus discolor]